MIAKPVSEVARAAVVIQTIAASQNLEKKLSAAALERFEGQSFC